MDERLLKATARLFDNSGMRHPLRSLAALSLLTLGACGSGSATDAAGAPESVPFASTSTSAAPVTTPSTTAAPVPAADPAGTAPAGVADPAGLDPAAGSDEVSAALVTSLLSTEEGRTMVAEMMSQETGITQEQAVCFLENVDPDTMLSLSTLDATGATPDPSALPPEVLDDLMSAVSSCGIAPDSLLG